MGCSANQGELLGRPKHPLIVLRFGKDISIGYLFARPTYNPLGGYFWKVRLPCSLEPPYKVQLLFDRVAQSNRVMPVVLCHRRVINEIVGRMQSLGLQDLQYRVVPYSTRWDEPLKYLHVGEALTQTNILVSRLDNVP